MDIERLHTEHLVAADLNEAFTMSVNAGMDMHIHGPHFFESVVEGVRSGKIPEKRVNEAVRKILKTKFLLGLFENPYVESVESEKILFNEVHQQTALQLARESLVLLKNEHILPLDPQDYKTILVTGPNAHSNAILGDWAVSQPEWHMVTVLDGLKEISPETNFVFHDVGWNIPKMEAGKIQEVTGIARKCDLAIVVVGEYSMRENWLDKTCGENTDRSDIHLPGLQQELVEAVHNTGIPTIVILINGRPLGVELIAEHVSSLIEAWEPGVMGGRAIAELLYGVVNPSGKLPVTIPRHVGQLQMIYNRKNTATSFNYAFGKSDPLYEFGYGLSYTSYSYSILVLSAEKIAPDESTEVSFRVTNTGDREGEEIVQLYIQDNYSSVTRPVKELKGFKKIFLEPGETKEVCFMITPDMLSFYDHTMQRVVEPGTFTIMTGGSSRNEDLKKTILEVVDK